MNDRSGSTPRVPGMVMIAVLSMLLSPALCNHTAAREVDCAVEEPPDTCLVLSGGGARGAAHIGVLKVLDELRIPVDCVVGTSMGAVIGGLYASGVPAGELERIFTGADWRDLLNDRPPRQNIPFRRKQDDELSLFQFEFGLNKRGIVLPSGLIAGQKLDFMLKSLTLPVTESWDFNLLPIPFRAIATDLATGEMMVLDHGNLADAMRASMAVPGAFTPAEIDGRPAVDGGLVRNLPIDVAREMGAGRIIAVDVTAPLEKVPSGGSMVEVAMQMVDFLTDRNVREQMDLLQEDDILVKPDLGDIRTTDFERIPQAVAMGEAAARERESYLSGLSLTEEEYGAHLALIEARRPAADAPVVIDEVRVTGVERVNPRLITARVQSKPGSPLDMEKLHRDLECVYEMGDFQRVDFSISNENGRNLLDIDAREKSWGPNFLRLGLDLEADFEGQGEFTVLANLRRARVNRLGAEVKTLVSIGEENSIQTEFYQPLDYSGIWFISPQVDLIRVREDTYNEDATITSYLFKTGAVRFDIGAQFRKYGEIRLGVERGRTTAEQIADVETPDQLEIDRGGWIGSLIIDRLDNANFPRRGTLVRAELFLSRDGLGADETYDRLETEVIRADSFGRHTFVGAVRYGTGLGSTIPFYDEFSLGGFLNLSGFRSGRLRGQVAGIAQLIYYTRVGRLPGGLGDGFYIGGSLEGGNVWQNADEVEFSDLRPAAAIFAGLDTVFGPLYLGYGRADGERDSFYLFLGQSF